MALENVFYHFRNEKARNWVGSIGVTGRSKIGKMVPIGNPTWPPSNSFCKAIFRLFSWTQSWIDSKLGKKHWITCSQNKYKICHIGNPRWSLWRPSWNCPFSSWNEGQLTWNWVGSIGDQRWPLWLPSWQCIFHCFSWMERPIDWKLGRGLVNQIAKIVPISHPRWQYCGQVESIYCFFSWTEVPIDSKLHCTYRDDL